MPGGREEDIFMEGHQFYTFITKLHPLGSRSHEIYNFLSHPTNVTYQNLVRLAKKMLTHDARWRTPTNSNRSVQLLRWPKNLKYTHTFWFCVWVHCYLFRNVYIFQLLTCMIEKGPKIFKPEGDASHDTLSSVSSQKHVIWILADMEQKV